MTLRGFCAAGITALITACVGETPPRPAVEDEPPAAALPPAEAPIELVDPAMPLAVAGEDGWGYRLAADADLNGDGVAERVILTARVEMIRGRPAWDDGQPWQVYIEDDAGQRTHVYAQRLQLGTLTMRVSRAEAGQPATVVLLEHLPDQLSLYEISYSGPAAATASVRFQRGMDPRGEVASPRLP
ncbi:MAG TPA: hypothetical protein VMK53_04580 [Gemmatimonadales bacterium]|nr:hypothetical protein [Gemmatimonadales bacterium]